MIRLDCSLRFLVACAGAGLGRRDGAAAGDRHGFDCNGGYCCNAAGHLHNYVDCHNVVGFHSVGSAPRHDDAHLDALRDTGRTGTQLAAALVSVCKTPRKFGRRRWTDP